MFCYPHSYHWIDALIFLIVNGFIDHNFPRYGVIETLPDADLDMMIDLCFQENEKYEI